MGCSSRYIKEKLLYDNVLVRKFLLSKEKKFISAIDLDCIKSSKSIALFPANVDDIETFDEIKHIVVHFYKVMREHFPDEYLNNLYRNISLVKIEIASKGKLDFKNALGLYYPVINKIALIKNCELNVIYHELLHMCSNGIDINSGFNYYQDNKNIGNSFDEGYTQLLSERYFEAPKRPSYTLEKKIVNMVENFVGKDLMEKAYLTADLKSVITELKKSFSSKEIVDFLNTLDILSYLKGKKSILLSGYIYDKIELVVLFLIKGYCIFLSKQNLSIEEVKNRIEIDFKDLMFSMFGNPSIDMAFQARMQEIEEKYLGYRLDLSNDNKKK